MLVCVTDDGDVDFAGSVLLALDKNTSLNYTLPFSLSHRVLVYDITSDGTLPSGVGYPAVEDKQNNQGSKIMYTREGIQY